MSSYRLNNSNKNKIVAQKKVLAYKPLNVNFTSTVSVPITVEVASKEPPKANKPELYSARTHTPVVKQQWQKAPVIPAPLLPAPTSANKPAQKKASQFGGFQPRNVKTLFTYKPSAKRDEQSAAPIDQLEKLESEMPVIVKCTQEPAELNEPAPMLNADHFREDEDLELDLDLSQMIANYQSMSKNVKATDPDRELIMDIVAPERAPPESPAKSPILSADIDAENKEDNGSTYDSDLESDSEDDETWTRATNVLQEYLALLRRPPSAAQSPSKKRVIDLSQEQEESSAERVIAPSSKKQKMVLQLEDDPEIQPTQPYYDNGNSQSIHVLSDDEDEDEDKLSTPTSKKTHVEKS